MDHVQATSSLVFPCMIWFFLGLLHPLLMFSDPDQICFLDAFASLAPNHLCLSASLDIHSALWRRNQVPY